MIETFRSKPLMSFFEENDASKIRPDQIEKVRRILARLEVASEIKDMNAPGLGLHPLVGNLTGYWAVTVRNNWRISFWLEGAKAYNVDYRDYTLIW
jgi:proteic killer suppression protein